MIRSKNLGLMILSLAALVWTTGCATNAPPDTVDDHPNVVVSYEPIDAAPPIDAFETPRQEYRAGVDLVAAGELTAGEDQSAAALESLRDATESCLATPDCDPRQILATAEAMLATSMHALERQSERIRRLESAEPDPPSIPLDTLDEGMIDTNPIDLGSVSIEDGHVAEWLTMNGPVRAEIDDWLTWRRPMLLEAWENYQFLRPSMAPVYEEAGLPEALLFGMLATESGGKVHARSRAGAGGPLQFMSYTGRRYGLVVENGFDLRFDPAAATRANVAYLQEQLAVFDESVEKALAAYNGGENRMRGLHRRTGGASLWDSRVYYSLPRETRDYVPRVLAAAWLFEHPERYNLVLPEDSTRTTDLTLAREAALDELTVCIGPASDRPRGWFRALRNLNPRYEAGEPLPAGTVLEVPEVVVPAYEANCLEGDLVTLALELRQANYPPEPPIVTYTVRQGDTLGRIASKFQCASVSSISSLNGIRAPRYVIRAGQQLKVPTCS